MIESKPQRLDPFRLPLHAERLIEASAGTGKTFTIGVLYLRLLLGLGGEAAYSRPLAVDEILVVTFTEAATAELRGRIRENIHQLRLACVRGHSDNPVLATLLAALPSPEAAADWLLAAERQMDEAAIFTIHGFCQRMLNLNAFESGMPFEQTLLEDEQLLRRQATADFWRRHCYSLPLPVARAVAEIWRGPDQLLATLSPWLGGEAPRFKTAPDAAETLSGRHARIIARIDAMKALWRAQGANVAALIGASGVDKRSYSNRYLPEWLKKIDLWAATTTENYEVVKELERFSQRVLEEKTKKGDVPRHGLFTAIDDFLAQPRSLRDLLIALALKEVRQTIRQEKRQRAQLGFDDLLSRLDDALCSESGDSLAQAIRQRFPVALIDEFQDTDPQQYRIFHRLYAGRQDNALLLIGDPKQAIYAFRGADIFTYMKARAEVKAHYTLETNWRSSPAMVSSVNRLFASVSQPFLFQQIPFIPVQPAAANQALRLMLAGKEQPALRFWLQPGEGVSRRDYLDYMAGLCAADICRWLQAGQQGEALLVADGNQRPVQASDITVLVRSRHEAVLIRDALADFAIPSVYLSNRESVFATPEAREILWLLQAVLAPEHERTLRSALATSLFGFDAPTLDALAQNEQQWDALVDEFSEYRECWLSRGVLPMLRDWMMRRSIAENLLASEAGERRLTDVMHLGELLQEASASLDSEHALVRWLAQSVAEPDSNAASQQMRLESDRHLVQIVTVHKSKGLEYPLVWLPFIAGFRESEQGLYHDRQSYEPLLDLQDDAASLALADQERLAEDLRLLYVALTRAKWHCSIGVAALIKGQRKKEGVSDLHKGALGWLLQRGEALDAAGLRRALEALCHHEIALATLAQDEPVCWQPANQPIGRLSSLHFSRVLSDRWRVTSYSGLQQHGQTPALDLLPHLDIDAAGEGGEMAQPVLSPHSFPRGAAPGTFLHSLFEQLDFTQPVDADWLAQAIQTAGYQPHWLPVIQQWMETVLQAPLMDNGLRLQQLDKASKRAEMAFYLPINRLLNAATLDRLIRRFDPLSQQTPPLHFHQVQGMLKGFIDLVFCWQGRYYLLDYKSNWLGEDAAAYTREAMEEAMCSHRYDLQYQLYSLALHRYLRQRIKDYDYEAHFGGVIYLFLRGVDGSGNGIFTTRPDVRLLAELDRCFAGSEEETL
ncbi:exodeoxyribonuclease V subunit beta [Erwinia sp. OLTSP20]|uniref:exodeoxyribonuclease V subunit beta n=1 Tax=unclassified Erwinia TaxID=2622719 RepID=UPI000C1A7557|nr:MULTISPECIES: exodeoxyribonuclease V subunit beta [unclassified Erwinia]PIJ49077.1 exodeoxyribonuclease V subunit beta [Erwinia sp. OAMSP11]PIJ75064.1 exodeoxyribonuclease V subunit beta [Erwinia sp. OLSSP12]PIJ79761.1 exodeoxyribonuclease V subunit beta [Erwinia sp. OLCASP19]PIJ80546.1 exodeoxyribonuclease V subunit beta [Erwinia sp. OLMTSP26]PIJ82660.1 exodeoxyribonuclease V subunit beta [Erwinia sp. OLMDSP33]